MKAVIFQMSFPGAMEQARPIVEAIRATGGEVVFVSYWSLGWSATDELPADADGFSYLTITDGGFDAIAPLSREHYLKLCGDDVDFPRCLAQNFINEGFPRDYDNVFLDSAHYGRYYGFAYRIEQLIKSIAPDVVLVGHGGEPISKIIYAKAAKLGAAPLLWETSFFPDKMLVDSDGMHFFKGHTRLDRTWDHIRRRKLDDRQKRQLDDFISAWAHKGQSKYAQTTDDAERQELENFLAGGDKVLFFPGQVPHDANVVTGLNVFSSYEEILPFVQKNLPPGWRVVHKVHPRDPLNTLEAGRISDNTFVVKDFSIHELLKLADAVFVHSSNVGLEALMYDKPVICCGTPHYCGKGLTLDMASRDALAECLRSADGFSAPPDVRESYLHHVIFEYLIDEGDSSALLTRLAEARDIRQDSRSRRAPFCENYPAELASHVAFIESYNELAARGASRASHEEILQSLLGPTRKADPRDLRLETVRSFPASALRAGCDEFRSGDWIVCTPGLRRRAATDSDVVSFGPYCALDRGNYLLKLDMDVTAGRGAPWKNSFLVDVVSNGGKKRHTRLRTAKLTKSDDGFEGKFELDETVNDLEVVIRAGGNSFVVLRGLEICRMQGTPGHAR